MSKKKTIIKSLGIGSTLALAMLACAGISQIPEVGNSTTPVVETSNMKLNNIKLAATSNEVQSNQEFLEFSYSTTYKDKVWTDGETVEYYGCKYIYQKSYDRFIVAQSDNPAAVTTLALPTKIFGKNTIYNTTNGSTMLDVSEYTNLETLIIFQKIYTMTPTQFENLHLKNIYVAYSFDFLYYYPSITCDNLFYVGTISSYSSNVSDINAYPEKQQALGAKHHYYYDWSSLYFDKGAAIYNKTYPTATQWEKLSESECVFAKESFYPCEDYVLTKRENSCFLVHSSSSSAMPTPKTHTELNYEVLEADPRITSITIPENWSNDNLVREIGTFEWLDIRYKGLGAISSYAAKNIVLGNTGTSFYGQYINSNVENIYFTNIDPSTVIASVSSASSCKANKIYIPENSKEIFNSIITNSTLASKVVYYSGDLEPFIGFTNDDGTATYKCKDINIDISTCLAGIPNLEMNDITVGPDDYLDEKLLSLGLPTTLEEAEPFVFSDIYCTKKANLQTLMDDMFPRLVYTKLGFYQHDYDIDFTINQFDISYTITLADSTVLTGKINIHRYESELGDYVAFYSLDNQRYQLWMNEEMIKPDVVNTSILTEVLQQSVNVETAPTYSPLDLSEGGAVAYEVTTDSETYLFDIIVSEDKFEYTMGQITNQDGTTTDVPVEDQSEAIAGYHITSTIYFTDGFNIDEVLKLIEPYMLYKDGAVVDPATYKTTYSLNATGWLTVKCTNDKDEVLASMMFQPRKVTNSKVDFIYIEQAGYMAKLFVNPTTTTHTMDEIFETAFSTGRVYITRPTSIPTMTMNKACQSDNISSIFMAGNGKYYNYTVKAYVLNIPKEIESSTLTIEVPEDLVLATFTPNKGLVGEKEEVEIVKTNPVEDIYNDVVDKVKENKAYQALAIVLGSVLGLGLLWLLWKIIRKIIKFFK